MTTHKRLLGARLTIDIECAIARGESPAYIAEKLRCTLFDVAYVTARLDEINADTDGREHNTANVHPCGTYAAYRRHCRDETKPCQPCKTAYAAYREQERGKERDRSAQRRLRSVS